MVAERPLPAGTRVTLQGTALGILGEIGCNERVRIDGDDGTFRYFPREALTVVVPPEPQWQVGDAIRIDGNTHMRARGVRGGDIWAEAETGLSMAEGWVSRAWSEGRVQVLWPQVDQGAGDE